MKLKPNGSDQCKASLAVAFLAGSLAIAIRAGTAGAEEVENVPIDREHSYAELAHELASFNGVVVGVMDDPHFAGKEVPSTLRFEDFVKTWGAIPGVRVVPLDACQIQSYSILFKGKIDILVYPYGSIYPMDTPMSFSGQYFNDFLKRGGAVLTTGGIPFAEQADPNGHVVATDTLEKLRSAYDDLISRFGIKYYQCRVAPASERADRDLLPELSSCGWRPSSTGVVVINSAHEPEPHPPSGNVFPERTPVRTIIPLLCGYDTWGQQLSVSAVLAQDCENGSRRIHFTHEDAAHPLSPGDPNFQQLMRALFELLNNRIFVEDVESDYACYRQGEHVSVRAELASFEPKATVQAVLEIADAAGNIVHKAETLVTLKKSAHLTQTWKWSPGKFNSDEYVIRVFLRRGGRVVSKAKNGFVVWNPEVVKHGPKFGIKGNYFTINDEPAVITGANYYESTRGEAMWFRPNVANIIHDYQLMNASGVNMIRPHYHHLKWFKDYLLYQDGQLPEFYHALNAIVSAMPDERVWRIWDMFMYLDQKYGIIYNGDLFTLVPEEMGDPRGWYGTVETVYDLSRRPAQKEFLLALDRRYRDIPGITWDLYNEPHNISVPALMDWVGDLRSSLVADGGHRLLTVGGPRHLSDGVDYDAPHGLFGPNWHNTNSFPVLMQELHIDCPEDLAAEMKQAEMFRDATVGMLRSGCAGWMPWSWTRQMRLWQDNFANNSRMACEKWDDRLGMNTHDDGTLKPAGLVFKDISVLLADVRPMDYDPKTRRVTTTSGTLTARLASETATGDEILHFNASGCLDGMAKGAIDLNGQSLVHGPKDAYLFMRALHGDFSHASEILVKSELPGDLVINRGGTAGVQLVDASPTTCRVLASVPFSTTKDVTRLHMDPAMTSYWLRVNYTEQDHESE